MLLADLQKVRDLDSKISDMHRRLASLYQERSMLLDDTEQPTDEQFSTPLTAKQLYQQAASEWKVYGITLPAYTALKSKFVKAEKTLKMLNKNLPDIAADMEILVVPPSKLFNFPLQPDLRSKQGVTELPDYVQSEIKPLKQQKNWQILLAYVHPESLYAGSAEKLLANKSYMLADFDTRGLGLREYAALTIQKNTLFDHESWTVLLKNASKSGQIPYVGYRHGRYRFDLEELDNVLDDDGFRPAIRI